MNLRATCSAPLIIGTFALLLAGACSSDAKHPSLVSEGGSNSAGAGHSGTASGGESGASDSPAGGEGGVSGSDENGSAGEPATAGETGTGEPPVAPSACSDNAVWSNASAVASVTSAAGETLLAVTADELDLAFLRGDALYVAHRAQPSAAFAIGAPVSVPSGWSAAQGASLSADGKRLLLVSDPDQKKLGQMLRASRELPFAGPVDESAFQAINQDSVYTGKLYASPVVSPTDQQLFFNSAFPSGGSTVVVSIGADGSSWSAPLQLTPGLLDGDTGARRLPSGVSADQRTLFYFNEETMAEEARFRDAPNAKSPPYTLLSLGMRRGATPNTACDRLYSASGGDVVVEQD